MVFGLHSGLAAVAILAHTILAKSCMVVLFRARLGLFLSPGAEASKIMESQFFKRVHATQLNEAEYSPLIFAGLLFLFSKGVTAPAASALCLGGQVIYFWTRALVGSAYEGGFNPVRPQSAPTLTCPGPLRCRGAAPPRAHPLQPCYFPSSLDSRPASRLRPTAAVRHRRYGAPYWAVPHDV